MSAHSRVRVHRVCKEAGLIRNPSRKPHSLGQVFLQLRYTQKVPLVAPCSPVRGERATAFEDMGKGRTKDLTSSIF